jgi:hypothetical protein
MSLHVGLSFATDETTLKDAFSEFGNVLEGCLSDLLRLVFFFLDFFLSVFNTSLLSVCIQLGSSLIGNQGGQGVLVL